MKLDLLANEMAAVILPAMLKGKAISHDAVFIEVEVGSDACFVDQDDDTFTIEISEDVLKNPKELYVSMAHELIHVAQLLRGDVFDFSKPYREQEHEIEAYDLEETMVDIYLLH